jgi:hypothetical protein
MHYRAHVGERSASEDRTIHGRSHPHCSVPSTSSSTASTASRSTKSFDSTRASTAASSNATSEVQLQFLDVPQAEAIINNFCGQLAKCITKSNVEDPDGDIDAVTVCSTALLTSSYFPAFLGIELEINNNK